jgi:hypothetical protein
MALQCCRQLSRQEPVESRAELHAAGKECRAWTVCLASRAWALGSGVNPHPRAGAFGRITDDDSNHVFSVLGDVVLRWYSIWPTAAKPNPVPALGRDGGAVESARGLRRSPCSSEKALDHEWPSRNLPLRPRQGQSLHRARGTTAADPRLLVSGVLVPSVRGRERAEAREEAHEAEPHGDLSVLPLQRVPRATSAAGARHVAVARQRRRVLT